MAAAAPSRALGALGPAASRPLARTRSSSKPARAARAVPRAATATEPPAGETADSVLGMTFTNWLLHEEKAGRVDADMAVLLSSVSVACKKIAAAVRTDYYKPGVDLPAAANALFRDAMVGCGRTGVVASGSEDAKPFAVEESFAGDRVVVFDPLDGVTNVDAAVCTGSIFGVYKSKSECVPDWSADADDSDVDQLCVANACNPGRNLECAGYCMYSSSTILMLTVGDGLFGFTFDPAVGEFVASHERVRVPARGKIYSVNEGNRDGWSAGVKSWVDALKNGGPDESGKPYSARYIGSLVADVHRTLLYGGVCAQPASAQNPDGRLRLLTEAGPMAFVAEQAGAKASTGAGRALDAEPSSVHQRTPFYLGSPEEVDFLEKTLAAAPPDPPRAEKAAANPEGSGKSAAFPSRTATQAASSRVGAETLSTWMFRQEQAGHMDADLAVIINSIAVACKRISNLVATAPIRGLVGLADSTNESGDEQKKLDVISNDIFCDAMRDTARSAVIVTEEEDVPVGVADAVGGYLVSFDPIDGSSNIDAAVPTGSIWGVYHPGADECVLDPEDDAETALEKCVLNARKTGEQLACAGYVLYSSSTVMMLTVGSGVYGFTLDWNTGEFVLSHENVKIPETTAATNRWYSGNQGNVDKWAPEMRAYAEHLQNGGGGDENDATKKSGDPFVYRYIGALVGDFHRTLLFGGIWLYPPDSSAPDGKARLLYEVAPMGFMAEQAGGAATRGPEAKDRVVEVVPETIHQRSPMFVGSKSMVTGLQKFLETANKAPP